MKYKVVFGRSAQMIFLALAGMLIGTASGFGSSISLEGQDKGVTNTWTSGNLQNWEELDYVPVRVRIEGGPISNQVITITFPGLTATTPGFEGLFNFTNTPNVVFVSGPTVSTPASGDWSVTFTVNITSSASADVAFLARMAVGDHFYGGSSLMIGGTPQSMGQLQIHNPNPGAGLPDLAITKTGTASVPQGGTINYTLTYTNKATGTNGATGVQITDFLPSGVVVDSNTLPANATLVGSTIFWDLTNVAVQSGGVVTFQAQVPLATPTGVITNVAQIFGSQNDANTTDNTSSFLTTITSGCFAPTVTNNPASAVKCPGDSVTFTVGASGTAPLSYQWRKNTANISGATGSSYTIASVVSTNSGSYDVVVSNACGTNTSSAATLTVNTNTTASGPVDQNACPGDNVTFTTTASGTGPFTYVWKRNGTVISGATSSSFTTNGVQASAAGTYSVVVTGHCNSVTNSATLTVNTATTASGPADQNACPGDNVTFTTTPSGTGPFTYVWKKDGGVISGATSSSFTTNGVQASAAGTYTVIVTGHCNSVTNSATLTVNTAATASGPTDQTVCPGDNATFTTTPSGTGPFTYVWKRNGSVISGATSSSFTTNSVQASAAGTYTVEINGHCGSVTNSATLTVNTATTASGPGDQTVCPGDNVTFTTAPSGTGPFTYVWKKDGVAIDSATNSSFTTNGVQASAAGTYTVEVTGHCNSVTNSATLTVDTATTADGPGDQTVCPGSDVTFITTPSGTGPFTYVWKKDGVAIDSATNSTFTTNGVQASAAGTYAVEVTGHCNSVTNSATLTVNTATTASGPGDQTVCPGSDVTFITTASGTGPFTYVWKKDGVTIDGATGNSFTTNGVGSSAAGTYTVEVTGLCNSVTNSAALTVNTGASAVGPTDQTACPGDNVTFITTPSGTGPFSYVWKKDGVTIDGAASGSFTTNGVQASASGTYTVEVTGNCGSVTNSATLTVFTNTSVAAIPSVVKNLGDSVTFTAVASGTGPFSYQWFKNGNPLSGETNSTLTITNLNADSGGLFSVQVLGHCGEAAASAATLTMNLPPIVNITYPTNGQVFVTPATFDVIADASDPDGSVTNVEFFESTNGVNFNLIWQTNGSPYVTVVSNLPPGTYTFEARATDNLGEQGVSALVVVTVVTQQPPTVTVVGAMRLNTQDGNLWLTNVVFNPLQSIANAARVSIFGLPANGQVNVVNASGTNAGIPFVQSPGAIEPGGYWTNIIKLHDRFGTNVFHPTLTVVLVTPDAGGFSAGVGTPQAIFSGHFLRDGTFLVEFATIAGKTYFVQYSSDLINWNTVLPPFVGTGGHLQFIDAGPPQTISMPSISVTRYYRVFMK